MCHIGTSSFQIIAMQKIIRACTVSQSIGFVSGMLPELGRKYEVLVLSSPGPEMDEVAHKYKVRTIPVPMERHISPLRDVVSLWQLIRVFHRERPTMVHSLTPKAGLLCMVAAWLTRVPVRVHTFTGLVFPTATGLQRRILMLTDSLTCLCATHVIPEGEGVKNDLFRHGITKKPLQVLGYGNVRGIDMDRFSRRPEVMALADSLRKDGVFTFLFVGRIVRDKGMNELLAAFQRLNGAHPATRLVLIGNYEDSLDPISSEAREVIGSNPCVEAVGPKSGDELLAYYAAADCFVFPSYREGFPNTVLEAGAMGLPSIVTDINGSREIIVQGKNGVIIPSKDEQALYEAMQQMMNRNDERKYMAGQARQMVADRFEQGFVRQCLYKFYDKILPLALLFLLSLFTGSVEAQHAWGDQGNGTYINPVLNADYSDPDVIRVDNKYYMVASDFHFIGMQLLESDDMVNWRIVTQVYDRFDLPGWDTNEKYAGGSWAPAIRYHDGRFWIYFCTPHEGLFMTQAEKPEGPWSKLHCVKAVYHWEDPCPFWDDDGQAYLGRSQHGAGPIIVHKMSADGRTLLDDGVTVYTGPVAEGTKFLKRNGYYYLSIPEGGVGGGWQTVLRSKNIYGPYEKRVVLEQGSTSVNGPHQGAIVDTPKGEWWFFHFQETGALGRVVHLQPMHWQDDWPVIGVDIDRNGIGEPVKVWTKPVVEGTQAIQPQLPQTSDDFEGTVLSPQWQWNHNPANEAWSLTEHKGQLTLHGLKADDFKKARNTLTQKVMGYVSEATAVFDVSHLAEGGRAGLACIGKPDHLFGVMRQDGKLSLYRSGDDDTALTVYPFSFNAKKLYLRITFDIPGRQYRFSLSTDGRKFTTVGDPFYAGFGNWKGVRFGLYHYNKVREGGYITVSDVVYNCQDN